ncbi:MAG: tripartite tricarboxylate transporter substrate binding protein [Betaproteobacteria bacterium]|nr:tripartite tricarboxylate transporter substrate binding protein [Betaproteobacteria bacterium]
MVTSQAGGGNDVQARAIARGLTEALGQQVIVDNRASGVIPGEIVAKATPNGYTLLFYNNALWTGPLLQKTPYDPVRDFAPVTTATVAPNILVVSNGLAVNSVQQLIALAKAKPGALNYASSGLGASNHLAAELFKYMAGVDIVRIGYKGASAGLNDVMAGQVQVMFPTAGSVIPLIKLERVKPLAVTSLERSRVAPDLPTIAESGLPGYESLAIYGVFAPAGTPKPIIERLNNEIVRVLASPDVKKLFFKLGMETVGGSPAQLAEKVRDEMNRLGKVIKAAGIKAQ